MLEYHLGLFRHCSKSPFTFYLEDMFVQTFIFHSFLLLLGPVVFPDPPQDGPMESSGVIVGASGFGFVPPSGQQDHSKR